jgi:CheY-like chemotaxis protein
MDILIAEDDPTSRRILEVLLGKWGHRVVSTTDGDEALSVLVRDDAPAIGLLDWMMPGVDGVEICRRVRQRVHGRPLYLILVTARDGQTDVVDGLAAGADDYVVKPYQPDELRARLEVGIRMVTLQRELADRVAQLEQALEHVKTLQGLLPICSHCHSIRDPRQNWHALESYLSEHTDVLLSHSLCPACFEKHYAQYLDPEPGLALSGDPDADVGAGANSGTNAGASAGAMAGASARAGAGGDEVGEGVGDGAGEGVGDGAGEGGGDGAGEGRGDGAGEGRGDEAGEDNGGDRRGGPRG